MKLSDRLLPPPRMYLAFALAWTAEKVADATLTWIVLMLGGVELNPVPAWFIEKLGITKGLLVVLGIGLLAGYMLPPIIWALLHCERCKTRFERAIIPAVGGEIVVFQVLLIVALGMGFLPVALNALTLLFAVTRLGIA